MQKNGLKSGVAGNTSVQMAQFCFCAALTLFLPGIRFTRCLFPPAAEAARPEGRRAQSFLPAACNDPPMNLESLFTSVRPSQSRKPERAAPSLMAAQDGTHPGSCAVSVCVEA